MTSVEEKGGYDFVFALWFAHPLQASDFGK